jgi:hypothetical protein
MRLALLTVHASSLILISYYSAAFTTDLTLQDPALPFTNFEEFLKDGSYLLGMMPKSAQMDYFKVSKFNILIGLNFEKATIPTIHILPDVLRGMTRHKPGHVMLFRTTSCEKLELTASMSETDSTHHHRLMNP